jgi:hypothetical protein
MACKVPEKTSTLSRISSFLGVSTSSKVRQNTVP